jgi:hypothetical protein
MKRTKRLTKRERKSLDPARPAAAQNQHIHCIACGRHINPDEFASTPATATFVECDHGERFASCSSCLFESERLIAEHDKSGKPIAQAAAWH